MIMLARFTHVFSRDLLKHGLNGEIGTLYREC